MLGRTILSRTLLEIGAMVTLGVNYAGAYIVAFALDYPAETELYFHILIIFIVSLLFGALIVDMKRAIIYTIGALAIGIILAVAIISAPSMMLEQDIALVDVSVTVALVAVSRLLIVGVTFLIMGIIVGCLIGDAVSE